MNKELLISYSVLKKVYLDKAYASIELNKALNVNYDNCNTGLVTKIVYGVLEKDVSLEYIISKHVAKKPTDNLMIILKMGTYVNAFINSIPAFACVNELVEITKKYESKFLAGFVNATLKKIISEKASLPSIKNKPQHYSVKYSYPLWMTEKLLSGFDEQFVVDLLSCKLTNKTHIRVTDKNVNEFLEQLDKNKIEYEKTLFNNTYYVEYDKLIKLENLSKSYAVQGIPSIICCLQEKNKTNILDLCSAPGGKSVYLASLHERGQVTACDKTEKRIELVKGYAKKYGIKNIKTSVEDATVFNDDHVSKFDLVLCDVPCSNLGIIGKKPDIMLNKKPDDILSLAKIQAQILNNAGHYVLPGASLIYSTCTILKEENDDIIEQFLNNNKNFVVEEVNSFGINVKKTQFGTTFYPNISHVEGFFIGRLKRVK